MLFHTPEQRDAFFKSANRNLRAIPAGSAMSHAASTHLGIWGNSGALFADCAQIMLYELRQAAQNRGIRAEYSIEDIENSYLFRRAFQAARSPRENRMHNTIRSLGNNASHMTRQSEKWNSEQEIDLANLTENLLSELSNSPKINTEYP